MEHYSKIKLIGSGTFGQAWLVQSVMSLRNYALKELGVTSMSEQDRHLALNEAKILSKLKHKNIVRYKEAFVAEGKLCIAMEFAEQGDLYTRIKERNGTYFPEMQILDWFTQLCLALKYIHGQNILHRDLKTQNIFLSKNDVIKLGDFGIARMLNSTLDHAQTTVGTPYYLSPEMCQRKPYNHKSDMWSLGCVLYEMATLKHAFNATNFSALVIKILQGQYPPIPRVYGALLEDLVSVLLQKDPEDRPSAKQILYVPAMQPYVKKFLLVERERVDSMASDVYDVSGKCPSSCVIDAKEVGRTQGNAHVKAPRGKSLGEENRCGENTLKSHEHSRETNSKLRNIPPKNTTDRPCDNVCAPFHALKEIEEDSTCNNKATKPRETIIASENLLKLRARLRSRFFVSTAHAQERRYSEQNLVCAGACSRVSKERILSHGGQLEEIPHAEDDVFVKNQATVIPSRIPNSKYMTHRRDSLPKTLKENRSSSGKRIPEAVTRRRQKPAMSVCQPKCNEDIAIKKRHQSELAAQVEGDRCPKQRQQQLQRQVEVNFTGQSKVNDKENIEPFSSNAKVSAKRRASYSALKQIQSSTLEKQKARKTESHEDGKGTYTVLRGRKFSEYQIPEVEPKSHCDEKSHASEDKVREDNIGRGEFETVHESTRLSGRDGVRLASVNKEDCKNCTLESAIQSHSNEFASRNFKISKHRESEATCQKGHSSKFTFCGKTLHLENVSSNDSVFSLIEALRMQLERKLGTRLLAAVYRYITNSSIEKDDERVRRTVECILGEQNMVYFPVLLQLVACDAVYFH